MSKIIKMKNNWVTLGIAFNISVSYFISSKIEDQPLGETQDKVALLLRSWQSKKKEHSFYHLNHFISLLEYNYFTMLCQFLLCNEVNQPYVDVCLLPLKPPSHPSSRLSQSLELGSLCYRAASEKSILQKFTCTPMFIATLFTKAIHRSWRQPECPLTNEWIKNMWNSPSEATSEADWMRRGKRALPLLLAIQRNVRNSRNPQSQEFLGNSSIEQRNFQQGFPPSIPVCFYITVLHH